MSLPTGAVQLIVIIFLFISLDYIAVGLRIWSRHIQKTPLATSDWMAILALFITTGSVSNQLVAVFLGGIGYHLDYILKEHPEKFVIYLKVSISGQILWAAANTCVKVSILSLYTVLFPGRKFHLICYGVMVLTTMYLISVICEAFVFCSPVPYNWDKSIVGTCDVHGQSVAFETAGSINLVIDAFIVALPMPQLFGLKMQLSKKLSLASMFSLGAIICIISLLRVITVANWDMNDITYSAVGVSIYSVLEPTLGVINVCLPTIRPAILALAGKSPRKGHSVPEFSIGKDSGWNRYQSKGSGLVSKQTRLQNTVEDLPMTEFDRLDDESLLGTSVEGGFKNRSITGQHPGEITVERRWEVNGYRSDTTLETAQR